MLRLRHGRDRSGLPLVPFRRRSSVISDVSYAGVAELARDTLPRFGIGVSLVDMSDLEALAAAIRPNTKLIHTETPVNPLAA